MSTGVEYDQLEGLAQTRLPTSGGNRRVCWDRCNSGVYPIGRMLTQPPHRRMVDCYALVHEPRLCPTQDGRRIIKFYSPFPFLPVNGVPLVARLADKTSWAAYWHWRSTDRPL